MDDEKEKGVLTKIITSDTNGQRETPRVYLLRGLKYDKIQRECVMVLSTSILDDETVKDVVIKTITFEANESYEKPRCSPLRMPKA